MKRIHGLSLLAISIIYLFSCTNNKEISPPPEIDKAYAEILGTSHEMEINSMQALSLSFGSADGEPAEIIWNALYGTIENTKVREEVIYQAPESPVNEIISVSVKSSSVNLKTEYPLTILPLGALKTTADILIEVDTRTLTGIWVESGHPNENFTPPLRIKGTFRFDPETLAAAAGGSWPSFNMYDDQTHGDRIADDGIWSLKMIFPKGDGKVYFAFDDNSEFRVQYESGLAWRLKMAWLDLDEFPDDHSNPAFIPDTDKTIRWTAAMAEEGGIYEPAK